jgi:hypothetical protein
MSAQQKAKAAKRSRSVRIAENGGFNGSIAAATVAMDAIFGSLCGGCFNLS